MTGSRASARRKQRTSIAAHSNDGEKQASRNEPKRN
jgi:hypothetical protein